MRFADFCTRKEHNHLQTTYSPESRLFNLKREKQDYQQRFDCYSGPLSTRTSYPSPWSTNFFYRCHLTVRTCHWLYSQYSVTKQLISPVQSLSSINMHVWGVLLSSVNSWWRFLVIKMCWQRGIYLLLISQYIAQSIVFSTSEHFHLAHQWEQGRLSSALRMSRAFRHACNICRFRPSNLVCVYVSGSVECTHYIPMYVANMCRYLYVHDVFT